MEDKKKTILSCRYNIMWHTYLHNDIGMFKEYCKCYSCKKLYYDFKFNIFNLVDMINLLNTCQFHTEKKNNTIHH